jgi:hypothetical protein
VTAHLLVCVIPHYARQEMRGPLIHSRALAWERLVIFAERK